MENPSEGFEKLLAMLPAEAKDFAGTEFAQPAAMAYFGARGRDAAPREGDNAPRR